MVSQTKEQALQASIDKALSGISREALKDQVGSETGHGYPLGWSFDFDREFATNKIRGRRA